MFQDGVIEYYNKSLNAYKDAWGLEKNRQLNLGFWFSETKSLSEALRNLNVEVARRANASPGDRTLDAGCGVGGTCIYLATEHQCDAHGITLVPGQVELARKFSREAGVSYSTHFEVMDYNNTSFPDNYFDVVTGIESICHTPSKRTFLKEAYRILKPGGRLVLADTLQAKATLTPREHDYLYTYGFEGCKISSLDTPEQHLENLKELGYSQYQHEDMTRYVWPSIRRLRMLYYPAWMYNQYRALIGKPFGETEKAHTRMCYYLYTGIKKNLWSYGLIQAVK